jgi:hypothetical protein
MARRAPGAFARRERRLAWRQHDGGHADWPNMKYFIAWADRWMGRPTKITP